MKKKFLLPMLAMIFAVGMAFATADASVDDDAEKKYIYVDQTWRTIQAGQLDCGEGDIDCTVMFQDDPTSTVYEVYNSKNDTDPVLGSGGLNILQGSVPQN